MDKSSAFVLPAGINLDVADGTFRLEHSHDIHLEQTFGLPIGHIKTPADLTLHLDAVGGEIDAGGILTVDGSVTGKANATGGVSISGDLHGEATTGGDISIGGSVTGTATSQGSIVVSGDANDATLRASATIQVDGSVDGGQLHAEQTIIINGSVGAADLNAPKIVIDSPTVNASVLDCEGELHISGVVDAKRIAASVVHLTGDSVTVKAIAATQKVVLGPGVMKIDVVIAPEVDIHPDTTGRITVIESENTSNVGAVKGGFSLAEYEDLFGDSTQFLQERGVHASGASVALSVEDEAPAEAEVQPEDSASAVVEDGDSVEPPTEEVDEADEEIIELVADAVEQADDNDDLHAQLMSAVTKITSCYEGAEAPDAIHDLQKLIDAKDYENLRTNITEVWNGLLGFHQTKGIRPHHQVTHAFNVIHGLLQKTS